jgi:predicted NBD/HSP70 family sugar kinase
VSGVVTQLLPHLRLSLEPVASRTDADRVMSTILTLVATRAVESRADVVRVTGLARSTVTSHLKVLLDKQILQEAGEVQRSTRGRPPQRLVFGPASGVVLAADVGTDLARLAVSTLAQTLSAYEEVAIDIAAGPARTLDLISDHLEAMLRSSGTDVEPVRALVVGLPAPVDVRRGVPVRPPIMPGWDGFEVASHLHERFGCITLVDNEVNLMALGEARALPASQSPLLLIKVSTGIGGGLVLADGTLHHGIDGAAGDIGHVRASGYDDVKCLCGNVGCIEAVASAGALAERLVPGRRTPEEHLQDLLRRGEPRAVAHVKEAGLALGGVVASLVHFYNPARISLSGAITYSSDHLLAGVRSVVYQHALPLATRELTLAHSVLGDQAGVAGGVVTGVEQVLGPSAVRRLL